MAVHHVNARHTLAAGLATWSRLPALGIGLCLSTLAWAAQPAAPSFHLREYLNESWTQERVSFPVTLPESLDPQRLAVREAGGQITPLKYASNE